MKVRRPPAADEQDHILLPPRYIGHVPRMLCAAWDFYITAYRQFKCLSVSLERDLPLQDSGKFIERMPVQIEMRTRWK